MGDDAALVRTLRSLRDEQVQRCRTRVGQCDALRDEDTPPFRPLPRTEAYRLREQVRADAVRVEAYAEG